jgi:hypothetical protein
VNNRENGCRKDYSQIIHIEDSNKNKVDETYNNKTRYNIIKKDKINELLNINHTDLITERTDKFMNAISQFGISKINKGSRGDLTNKTSSVKIFSKQIINYSRNLETYSNTIRTVYPQLKNPILKQKTKFGFFEFNQNKSKRKYITKNLLSKNKEKIKFSISPIKCHKNKFGIKKYINYLLTNRNEPIIHEDFHPATSKIIIHSEEKRDINSMSLNDILKTRNKKTEESNYNGIKSINDNEITFKNNIFTFNSGIYTLPLMTHILNKNKFENNIK